MNDFQSKLLHILMKALLYCIGFPIVGPTLGSKWKKYSINFFFLNICINLNFHDYIFSYSSVKTYVVGTHQKRLNEALLMSTHSICLPGEIMKTMF